MSILSTNQRLISLGQDYSAGNGISIDNYVISYTGDEGQAYNAGPNIDIYTDQNQLYISGKDWSADIANASSNAFEQATALIPPEFDPSYISGVVDNKLDSTAFSTVSGDYATTSYVDMSDDLTYSRATAWAGQNLAPLNSVANNSAKWNEIEVYEQNSASYLTSHQDISNKLDTTAFSTVSGTFLTAHQSLDGYLTKSSADTLYQPIGSYASQSDLEQVSGDLKGEIDYISGVAITALPGDIATTGDISDLAQSISETYQPIGDYLTNADSANFYPMTGNPSGFITGVDLSNYYTKSQTSGATELADAFANIPAGDADVNAYVQGNSATIDNVNSTVQTNSAQWAQGGGSYRAGNGIDITDQVISVTGDATPYSAGENIDIQNHIISGKDWSQDIIDASSNAYNETTAWVQENYANSADMTYISAVVDTKLDASAWSTVSGNYATKDYVILADMIAYDRATVYVKNQQFAKESACQSAFDYLDTNKLNTEDFTAWQNGQYATDLQTIECQINNKLDESAFSQVSASFLTAINIPESATWNEVSQAYEQASGTYLTSVNIPESATWQDVSETVQTNSATWGQGGTGGDEEVNSFVYDNSATILDVDTTYQQNSATYLTAHQSLDGYATEDWVTGQGYITGVEIPESATWNEVSTTVQTNSSNWDNVSNKLDTTAFSDVSGTFLTAHQDLSDYYTTADASTLSSMLSGAIDYVSANAGDEFPVSADEAIQYVQTNSGTIDDVNTSYQTNSGTFLTAHQAISAEEWNDCYDNVNTNSGAWGGTPLPITARDGIDLEVDNGTLYIGASAMTGSIDYIETNSANIDETVSTVQSYSGVWGGAGITGVSHDNTLSGNGTVDSPLGVVPGYNETVLWENSAGASAFSLSEAATGFDKLQITYYPTEGGTAYSTVMYVPSTATSINLFSEYIKVSNDFIIEDVTKYITNDYTNYSYGAGVHAWYSTLMERQGGGGGDCFNKVTKVVGINRKQ